MRKHIPSSFYYALCAFFQLFLSFYSNCRVFISKLTLVLLSNTFYLFQDRNWIVLLHIEAIIMVSKKSAVTYSITCHFLMTHIFCHETPYLIFCHVKSCDCRLFSFLFIYYF